MSTRQFIADFHIHSKYSRATSKEMGVETIAKVAKKKGIALVGTGDFTHPAYVAELKAKLEPLGNGLHVLKDGERDTHFILTTEVSNIFTQPLQKGAGFSQKGGLKKIHTIIFAPSFQVVERINQKLARLGKLSADGRPTFGFPVKDLVKLILDISEDCLLVPAHAWTPWFSLFGANSGFDSIEECFQEEAKNIFAIETGLSSDPEMNWRLSSLDKITLISNSDAHSPAMLGREANVFQCPMDYKEIISTIKGKDKDKFLFTIEVFPEEGKYHYDGHRNCGILLSPSESKKLGNICPECHKKLTIGVMHRVKDLADRPQGFIPEEAIPALHLIPLGEIIADALGYGKGSAIVKKEYERILSKGYTEFDILMNVPQEELSSLVSKEIGQAIINMRKGKVDLIPGYDGVYGKIKIVKDEDKAEKAEQLSLF